MNYNTEDPPAYLSALVEAFPGAKIQAVSAKGTLWSIEQDDAVLKGERDMSPTQKNGGSVEFTIQLGRSAYANPTGKVSSTSQRVSTRSPSNTVSEIHEASTEAFTELMENGDDLVTAWKNTFGEKSVRADNRDD